MGLFTGLGTAVGTYFGYPGLGGLVGGILDNSASNQSSSETNDANIQNSERQQAFQQSMRATQWQTSVDDMKKAGINPMVAYGSGGAGNLAGASTAPMINKSAQAIQNSAQSAQTDVAQANVANINADTQLKAAQKDLTESQIGQTTTSTANTAQQTENLKEQINQIRATIRNVDEDTNLKMKQGWNATDQGNLLKAQQDLARIQALLEGGRIGLVDAQTQTEQIKAELAKLEIPGKKNAADWETSIGTAGKAAGAVGTGAKVFGGIVNSAQKIFGH